MSAEAREQPFAEQIRRMVEEELARMGRYPAPELQGTWLILGQGASAARAELQGTLSQWDSLPDDLRRRRAQQLAKLLAEAAAAPEAAAVPRPPPAQRGRRRWLSSAAPLFVVLVTLLALVAAYRLLAPDGQSRWAFWSALWSGARERAGSKPQPLDPDQERARLASRACNQTRARIARGANVTASDVEGWQVELVLLRRGPAVDLSLAPELARFVERTPGSPSGTVIWPNAKSLLAAQRFDAKVSVHALPAPEATQLNQISLVFSGPYVTPYFSETLRADYQMLAEGLAEALAANSGALYARCEGGDAHAIGSWFLGETPAAALGALVYFMAGYNELPILKPELLGSPSDPLQRARAFDAIAKATLRLDRSATATLVGREQGMIAGRRGQLTRLTFPFRDANRAARSSVDAARALGLARL